MLFGDSQTRLKDDLTIGTTQAVGGLTGLGVGMLARYPLDLKYQNDLLREGMRQTALRNLDISDYTKLIKIAKGELKFEDLRTSDREYYQNLFNEHEKDLRYLVDNPHKIKPALKDLDRGKVVPLFPGKQKVGLRNLFPQMGEVDFNKLELLNDQSNTRLKLHQDRHPKGKALQGALGLAGFLGSGFAMKEHLLNQKEKQV